MVFTIFLSAALYLNGSLPPNSTILSIEHLISEKACVKNITHWRRYYWFNEKYIGSKRVTDFNRIDFVYESVDLGHGRAIPVSHPIVEPADGDNKTISGSFILSSRKIEEFYCPMMNK